MIVLDRGCFFHFLHKSALKYFYRLMIIVVILHTPETLLVRREAMLHIDTSDDTFTVSIHENAGTSPLQSFVERQRMFLALHQPDIFQQPVIQCDQEATRITCFAHISPKRAVAGNPPPPPIDASIHKNIWKWGAGAIRATETPEVSRTRFSPLSHHRYSYLSQERGCDSLCFSEHRDISLSHTIAIEEILSNSMYTSYSGKEQLHGYSTKA